MHRILRQVATRRVANYSLLRRSLTSIKPVSRPQPLLLQLQARRLPLFQRNMNTYKETPFLKWKLFPDFQHLVDQTSPAVAVPAFEKIIEAAKKQFVQIEKTFEPTWEGTIGQCKSFSSIVHLKSLTCFR